MYDVDIRVQLRTVVGREHAGDSSTTVVEELGLMQGAARVDLAVINGAMKGYEIKSAADTLRRLPAQIECYGKVLDFVDIVLADEHRADAIALVPPWWGVIVASRTKRGRVTLSRERPAERNEGVCSRALVELLWHEDAVALLRTRGEGRGMAKRPRREAWDRIVSVFTRDEIAQTVRDRIKARAAQPPVPLQPSCDAPCPTDAIPHLYRSRLPLRRT